MFVELTFLINISIFAAFMDNMLDESVLIITKTIKITTNYADKNMSDESMLITLTIAFTNIANKT